VSCPAPRRRTSRQRAATAAARKAPGEAVAQHVLCGDLTPRLRVQDHGSHGAPAAESTCAAGSAAAAGAFTAPACAAPGWRFGGVKRARRSRSASRRDQPTLARLEPLLRDGGGAQHGALSRARAALSGGTDSANPNNGEIKKRRRSGRCLCNTRSRTAGTDGVPHDGKKVARVLRENKTAQAAAATPCVHRGRNRAAPSVRAWAAGAARRTYT